jgi:hypothetical protein
MPAPRDVCSLGLQEVASDTRLKPAAPAVPAAAAKQQNDNYDDEKRGSIHVELLLAAPHVITH